MAPNRRPPGPKGHWLIGSLIPYTRDPLGFLASCARNYGDIARFKLPRLVVYAVNDPDAIEYVLRCNPENFSKGWRDVRIRRRPKNYRKVVQRAFQTDRLSLSPSLNTDHHFVSTLNDLAPNLAPLSTQLGLGMANGQARGLGCCSMATTAVLPAATTAPPLTWRNLDSTRRGRRRLMGPGVPLGQSSRGYGAPSHTPDL